MNTRATTRRAMLKKSLVGLACAPVAPRLLTSLVSAATRERGPATARHSAISTPHPEALAAAKTILEQGGNAVDAAAAALMALCVVEPHNVGLAGYGGSMVIYVARRSRAAAIDFDSRAPAAFRPESFTEQNARYGYLAPGVPGVVAGLDLALRTYGTLPWTTVFQHAVRLADQGFVVGPDLKRKLDQFCAQADRTSLAAFFADGRAPAEGELWRQPDLARVFRAIGEGGAGAFYRGDIARRIVKHLRDNGGMLTDADFRTFKAREVTPLRISYRAHEFFTPPPPSGGLTSLSILKTLENFDLASLEPWGAQYLHLLAQACKLCWRERLRLIGDPDFVKFSARHLLSDKAAEARSEQIRRGEVPPVLLGPPESPHTVNVVVIDKDQNIVSLTATQGDNFGSRVVVPELGLVLGHGMSRFALQPGPNFPAAGKRMQHNMSPMVILRGARPWAGLGMPGGRMIVTVTPQLAIDVIDFAAAAQQAIKAPRLHTEGDEPLKLSPGVSDAAVSRLESLGHKVQRLPAIGGSANIAIIDQLNGRIDAASGSGPSGVQVL